MSRKKRPLAASQIDELGPDNAGPHPIAVAETNTVATPTDTNNSGEAPPDQQSWATPYTIIFTSGTAGFEMGENRRFKQRVFIFKEKPDEPVLATLKENGFTYRPAEKAWTIPANAATRVLSDNLAQQFAGASAQIER